MPKRHRAEEVLENPIEKDDAYEEKGVPFATGTIGDVGLAYGLGALIVVLRRAAYFNQAKLSS